MPYFAGFSDWTAFAFYLSVHRGEPVVGSDSFSRPPRKMPFYCRASPFPLSPRPQSSGYSVFFHVSLALYLHPCHTSFYRNLLSFSQWLLMVLPSGKPARYPQTFRGSTVGSLVSAPEAAACFRPSPFFDDFLCPAAVTFRLNKALLLSIAAKPLTRHVILRLFGSKYIPWMGLVFSPPPALFPPKCLFLRRFPFSRCGLPELFESFLCET